MTETLTNKARRLILEAQGACNALNESLTDEQRDECEHLIGYAHDGLGSAEGYLETVARRLAGDEHWPVPIEKANQPAATVTVERIAIQRNLALRILGLPLNASPDEIRARGQSTETPGKCWCCGVDIPRPSEQAKPRIRPTAARGVAW